MTKEVEVSVGFLVPFWRYKKELEQAALAASKSMSGGYGMTVKSNFGLLDLSVLK